MAGTRAMPAKWRAFSAIASTYVVIVMASSMAFLVLPSIAEDFGVTLRTVGWVVIIESLIVSSLLLPLGALGDRLGRRRVLFVGMLIFALGAAFTGFAPTFAALIIARIVMSFGNTLVQSIATGLVIGVFPPEERGLAMGAQTTAVAIGSALGPLLVGILLNWVDWDVLFVALAVPSVASAFAVWHFIDPSVEVADKARGFDGLGAFLAAAGITVMVITISNPFEQSLTSPATLGGAAVIVVVLAAFVAWELRHQQPMLQLRLFALKVFRTAVLVRVLGFLSSTAQLLLLPIFLLSYWEATSGQTGLILSFGAIGMAISAQISGRLYDRVGPRTPTLVGLALQCGCYLLLAFTTRDTPLLLIGLYAAPIGFAVGLWNVPNNSAMMGATGPEALGVVGAFTNVTRTVGNVLGQAMAAAVVVAVMASNGFDIPLDEIDELPAAGDAFALGWRTACIVGAAVAAATGVVALNLPGHEPTGVPDTV